MFQELKPLLGKSPIAMMIALQGDQLRVTVEQKKAGKSGRHLNIVVTAPADELDRDLPGEIVKAADASPAKAPVAEQVQTQVAAATPTAAEPKAKKAAVAKSVKAKPAKPKPLKQARTPKHKAKSTAAKVRLPGKKKALRDEGGNPRAPYQSTKVKHHVNRPDKAACIADYKAMKAKHGDKLNRELFIDKSSTGRRFERLWGMSWLKFIAEADGSKVNPEPVAAPVAPKPATPLAPAKAAEPAKNAEPTGSDRDHSKAPARVIKNASGVFLAGGFQRFVNVGEELTLGRTQWVVTHFNDHQILVEPKATKEALT